MDILKFVVRSIMKGEIFLFKHKLSLHFQLVHGHQYHRQGQGHAAPDAEHPEWEEHVVTAGDLAHIPHQLKAKMMAKFKHAEDADEDQAKNGTASSSSAAVPAKTSSRNNLTKSGGAARKSSALNKSKKPEEKKLKRHSDDDATSDE
jgi:hypothetical protein